MNSNTWIGTGLVVSIVMLTLGCSDKHPSFEEEGCEHLKEGPSAAVTAASGADSAPAVAGDHKRYDVTLIDVGGGKGGFVKFAAAQAVDFVFFLDANVPLEFLDATNMAVAPEASATSSTVCAEIKGRHLVPLEVGTYVLKLGPTTLTSVGIVVEEAAHDH